VIKLDAYSDADWASDTESRRSTSGLLVMINDAPVIFASRKQKSVALSSTEAEYIAAGEVVKELKWPTQFSSEIRVTHGKPRLHIDNQSEIKQIENIDIERRSKHVDLRYHFIRECYQQSIFNLNYIETERQIADILTKPISGLRMTFLLGCCNIRPVAEARDTKGSLGRMLLLAATCLCLTPQVAGRRFRHRIHLSSWTLNSDLRKMSVISRWT